MRLVIASGMTQIPDPKSLIVRAANALATSLLAPVCAVCGAMLDEPLSGCVCKSCWGLIRPITPPVCDRCGDPLARQHQSPHCTPQSAVDRARAVGEYQGVLREIVHALKYERRQSLARPLAALMRSRGAALVEDADVIVPVPLHWRREHQRGFNQARELARYLGPPVANVLARRRRTRPQVELAADRRRANVEGAFRLRRHWRLDFDIEGRRVLLVDDVSTTGATLESCANVLKEHGASEVYALTAARVVTTRRLVQP